MKKNSPPFVLTFFFFLIFELLNKSLANPDSNNEFFIENKGQWPDNVLFQSKLKGQDLWITKNGFVIDQYEIRRGIDLKLPEHFSNSESFSITKVGHAVSVSNIGASTKTTGSGKHLCKGIYNYFSGTDPSKWISNVSLYKEVEIKNIYPNVNQRWYFDNGMPRFDYVVLPGGKPQNIKLKIEGANNVSIQDNQLVLSAGSNLIRLSGLYAYQVINEKRVEIPSSWVIDENGNAGFLLGSYNKNLPVVIDPIIWSAYLGGTGADIAVKVRTDNSGNVYVTGLTASNNFPTIFGSYSVSQIGSDDVFVTKTNGNTLIYSTYIGSTGIDRALALRVENGNAIVGGFCSNGFPVNLAHQPTFGGSLDGFLLKLNAAGNGLIFSTYLGSHFNDFINDLDINQNNGRIYVTGYTKSNLFPVTTGAFDVSYNSNDDIFITCYSSSGNLLSSTFLGGGGDEVAQAIKVISESGDVVIGGSSRSEMSPPGTNGIPVTAGAGANFYGSSSYQAPYLAILDSNLTNFKRGFFVAAHEGRVYGMDQDEYNRVFVVGTYGSSTHTVPSFTNYPLAFKNTPEPNTRDGFMFVLSSTGVDMSSTLYGGALNDYFLSVKVENSHNVTITGYSFSSDFPVSSGAHKNFLSGSSDAIILKLNFKSNTEWEVLYSSYLGGSSEEISYDVDANSQGQAFFVGRTNSSDFPTSTGTFGHIYKGAIDAFVTSMCLPLGADVQVYNQSTFDYYYIDTINICEANTIILTAFPESYNIQWSYPGGSSSSSVIYIDSTDVSEQGTYTVVVHRPGICASSKSFSKHFTFRPNPSFNVYGIPVSSLCEGLSLQLITDNNDAQNYYWYSPWNTHSSNSNDTFTIHNIYSMGNPHYVYVTLSDSTGCSTIKEFNVYVQKCHDYKWEGNVDNDWFNPANWHMGMIPGSCSDNTLISTEGTYLPIISSGTIQVGNLILANNAEILLLSASSSLNVCGNIVATPYHGASFSGLGKVELNGTVAQSLDGKMKFDILRLNNSSGASLNNNCNISISGSLDLKTGNLDATFGKMRFLSPHVFSVGIIDNFSSGFSGTISGVVTAERAYSDAYDSKLYNQHLFSSPFDQVSFAQFSSTLTGANNVYVTPTADCDETTLHPSSNYGNVFEYDESNVSTCHLQAWKVKSAGNAENARGYSVVKLGSGTLVMSGVPNMGNYALAGLQNSGWILTSKQGNTYASGWHLLGNPYLAPLDLDYAVNTDFDNNVLVLHTHGPYAGTYQPLSMSGSGRLAPFQGFFARKSLIGGDPATFRINATDRRRAPVAFHKTDEYKMSLEVAGNGHRDITYFDFNENATNGYEPAFDGGKLRSIAGQPTIYSLIGSVWASVNVNKDVASTPSIPIGFEPGLDGTFRINAYGFEQLHGFSVYLEDKKAGVMHNLIKLPEYTFNAFKNDFNERFVLHFTPNTLSNVYSEKDLAIRVFPNPCIDKVYLDAQELQNCQIKLYDLAGKELEVNVANKNGIFEINTSQLPSACYNLKLISEQRVICVSLVKND